jgi:hypothetical protein
VSLPTIRLTKPHTSLPPRPHRATSRNFVPPQPSPALAWQPWPPGSGCSSCPHGRGACLAPERTPTKAGALPGCVSGQLTPALGCHPATRAKKRTYLNFRPFPLQKKKRGIAGVDHDLLVHESAYVFLVPPRRRAPRHPSARSSRPPGYTHAMPMRRDPSPRPRWRRGMALAYLPTMLGRNLQTRRTPPTSITFFPSRPVMQSPKLTYTHDD